jgi:hypothetical protein
MFGFLFAYPFIERRVYGLEGDWHVLTNPLEIPLRAALIGGVFVLLLLLSAAATNDILSRMTGIPVEVVTWIFTWSSHRSSGSPCLPHRARTAPRPPTRTCPADRGAAVRQTGIRARPAAPLAPPPGPGC